MRSGLKIVILCAALLGLGAARMPFEAGLSREMKSIGLLPPKIQISTSEKIGQTSSAVALGGLRTLVASFLNLRAFSLFTERKWDKVENTFYTIVDLAPHTRFYWDSGFWHMAYNASSYYAYGSDLTPLRRRELWREYILKGRAFLERGIRNNPGDWSLHADMGFMLTDPYKLGVFGNLNETFTAAAKAYHDSDATGKAPAYVRRFHMYALARVQGREKESLALVRALYAEGRQNRTTTLTVLLLVLEAHENPSMDVTKRAIELFGSPKNAYETLCIHWRRTNEHFPVYGLASAISSLEDTLSIPEKDRILNKPIPPPPGPDTWFHN